MQKYINSVMFQPPCDPTSPQHIALLKLKNRMEYTTKENGDRVYYLRVDPKTPSGAGYAPLVILYSHGNAEDLGCFYQVIAALSHVLGITVIGYDYCGFGLSGSVSTTSPTSPSEKAVYEDADAMFKRVIGMGFAAEQIIVMGRSVGGGPTCYLAQQHHKQLGGVILQSTFTTSFNVVSSCCLPCFCGCINPFKNIDRLKEATDCPLLIVHGTNDQVVPFHCSVELVDAAVTSRKKAQKKREKKGRSEAAAHVTNHEAREGQQEDDKGRARYQEEEVYPTNTSDDMTNLRKLREAPQHTPAKAGTDEGGGATSADEAARMEEEALSVYTHWFLQRGHNDIEAYSFQALVDVIANFLQVVRRRER